MADPKPADANPEALADVERVPPTQPVPPAAAAMPPPAPVQQQPVGGGAAVKTVVQDVATSISKASFTEQLALIAVMSAIELIQASILRGQVINSGWTNWAVSAGAVSFAIAATLFLLDALIGVKFGENMMTATALFFFCWWTAAAVSLTFWGPFISTCGYALSYQGNTGSANGYFATWLAFLASARLLADFGHRFAFFKSGISGTSPYMALNNVLIISSLIVMGAGIGPCSPQSQCYRYNAFSVALGVVPAGLCLIFLLVKGAAEPHTSVHRWFAAFLFVWYSVGTMVVTFGGPFYYTSNGYFASYASMLFAYGMLRFSS